MLVSIASFAEIVDTLAARYPRQFCAGQCHQRAQAAALAFKAAGYDSRISNRLPPEAFGYQPRTVWLWGDGSYSLDLPIRPGGLRVSRADGHFVCLVNAGGYCWMVDLAAGQFGIEEHPVIRPWSEPTADSEHSAS